MVPGDIFIYCIEVDSQTSVSIDITKVISNNVSKQGNLGTYEDRISYSTSYKINVGWAIDVFTYIATPTHGNAPTGYNSSFLTNKTQTETFRDKFDYIDDSTGNTALNAPGTGSAPNKEVTLAGTGKNIYANASLSSSNDLYVFYSVVFSDDASRTYYKEVESSSSTTETYAPATTISNSTEYIYNRYFLKNSGGSSGCYAGLKFALNEIVVTIG